MKQNFKQSLKIIVVGMLLSVGLSYVAAQTAISPTPSGNTLPPIDISSTSQVKSGSLYTNSLLVVGGTQISSGIEVGITNVPTTIMTVYGKTGVGNHTYSDSLKINNLTANSRLCVSTTGEMVGC